MKKIICIALLSFVGIFLHAQNDTIYSYEEEDYYTTIKDLREKEKLRIGVDVSTITVGALAGANMRPRASLIFNLKTAPNRSWRFSPMYEQNRRFSDLNVATFDAYQVNDTAVLYRNEYTEEYRVSARIGTEWFKQYSKNTMVYGVDLVMGYHSDLCTFTDSYRSFDEDGTIDRFSVGAGYFDQQDIYSREAIRLMFGIDFSLGYKMFLSEKVDFIVEWIPEFTYRPFLKSLEHGELEVDLGVPEDNLVLDPRGLSIQFHYKFNKN